MPLEYKINIHSLSPLRRGLRSTPAGLRRPQKLLSPATKATVTSNKSYSGEIFGNPRRCHKSYCHQQQKLLLPTKPMLHSSVTKATLTITKSYSYQCQKP
ncbi:hypothetical protein RchiOBHm_Chr5g0038191 [Rosa chinensis]|uniref:Uncharacterized protein n=1 Tax=Rosa chinensis TaxID=74649 RepID=A0A2P6QBZ3_ROSCH|nr:hypothetical protein RchiOBHm_Chr5g0038191 [Rosa chinensis]